MTKRSAIDMLLEKRMDMGLNLDRASAASGPADNKKMEALVQDCVEERGLGQPTLMLTALKTLSTGYR